MLQQRNEQLAAMAKAVIASAAEKNLAARVMGGVAVHLSCESIETHPTLQREYADVDFVAVRRDFDALAALFAAMGWELRGKAERRWTFEKEGIGADLYDARYRDDHRIDFTARLALAAPTLPLADLLLLKLERKQMGEKDIKDAIALLLDHRVARGEAEGLALSAVEGQIDHLYIARATRGDWSLWTTVYDNTIALENILEKYLESEEAQLVWRRIELIQGDMDLQRKSLAWMLNQIVRRPTQVPR